MSLIVQEIRELEARIRELEETIRVWENTTTQLDDRISKAREIMKDVVVKSGWVNRVVVESNWVNREIEAALAALEGK